MIDLSKHINARDCHRYPRSRSISDNEEEVRTPAVSVRQSVGDAERGCGPKHHQRYTGTGIFECVSTLTVSLPRTTAATPRRPCEAITIRSHPLASAASMIA